jgi:hypothetical protein
MEEQANNRVSISYRRMPLTGEFIILLFGTVFLIVMAIFLGRLIIEIIVKLKGSENFLDIAYFGLGLLTYVMCMAGLCGLIYFYVKTLFAEIKDFYVKFEISPLAIKIVSKSSTSVINKSTFKSLRQISKVFVKEWVVVWQQNETTQSKIVFRKFLLGKENFKMVEQTLLTIKEGKVDVPTSTVLI